MQILKADTSAVIMLGPAVDKTDGVTLESGLVTAMDTATTGVRISKNGGAWTDRNGTVTTTVYDEGWYRVTLDATDTNTEGTLDVMFEEAATCLPMFARFQVVNANVYDSLFAASGTDLLQVDTTQIGGTTQTARDIGASVLLSPGTGTGQISLASGAVTAGTVSDKTGYSLTATTGLGNQTANITGNLSGSVGSISGVTFPTNFGDLSITVTTGLVDITQTAADKAWSTTTRVLTANTNLNDPTAAAIADAVWDEAQADHVGAGTFGEIATESAAILADTNELQTDWANGGRLDLLLDTTVAGSLSAAATAQLEQNLNNCFTGTVSGTPTTTTMVSDIGITVDDQFKGRIITFDDDTSTTALRGQSTDITACTAASNTLTFTALTTAPSSGDTFVIT